MLTTKHGAHSRTASTMMRCKMVLLSRASLPPYIEYQSPNNDRQINSPSRANRSHYRWTTQQFEAANPGGFQKSPAELLQNTPLIKDAQAMSCSYQLRRFLVEEQAQKLALCASVLVPEGRQHLAAGHNPSGIWLYCL